MPPPEVMAAFWKSYMESCAAAPTTASSSGAMDPAVDDDALSDFEFDSEDPEDPTTLEITVDDRAIQVELDKETTVQDLELLGKKQCYLEEGQMKVHCKPGICSCRGLLQKGQSAPSGRRTGRHMLGEGPFGGQWSLPPCSPGAE
eukprot:NODE_182_length_2549_cov_5.195600_g138_i0.p5 GENE.NODE_182_length_2549_cov_5.195600_g138_i0~~NODE_182_length_2549_cov_5.195600_g138_i0.p5  ORF type:complete len:145 (+),score=31.23 NODE_182_length_2549_cov_5.195600_g138_i0:901-1335(+)